MALSHASRLFGARTFPILHIAQDSNENSLALIV
jgi:hypothetical protein